MTGRDRPFIISSGLGRDERRSAMFLSADLDVVYPYVHGVFVLSLRHLA